jgi:hypothetical protein
MIPSSRPFLPPFRSSSYWASINQWICPRKLNVKITNLSFNDDQAMNTPLFDELKKRAY